MDMIVDAIGQWVSLALNPVFWLWVGVALAFERVGRLLARKRRPH